MQPDLPPPALRLELDRAALAANWQAMDRLSGSARAGAAVKADAYGLGARAVVPVLRDAGCRDFFVTYCSEAADILGLVPAGEIALLHGPLTLADAAWAKAAGVRPVINSLHQARLWHDAGGGLCEQLGEGVWRELAGGDGVERPAVFPDVLRRGPTLGVDDRDPATEAVRDREGCPCLP